MLLYVVVLGIFLNAAHNRSDEPLVTYEGTELLSKPACEAAAAFLEMYATANIRKNAPVALRAETWCIRAGIGI